MHLSMHQEIRVALILLNDTTSFASDEQRMVHTGASMPVRQRAGRQSGRGTMSCP
jgi:hypothetical protein